MRICARCQQPKDLIDFPKTFPYCRPCKNEYIRVWKKQNPVKAKAYDRRNNLKRNYGLSVEDWEWLFLSQGKRCAICNTNRSKNSRNPWHTDHNHETKQIRGILCFDCNMVLGYVEKGWMVKVPAIDHYLEVYS